MMTHLLKRMPKDEFGVYLKNIDVYIYIFIFNRYVKQLRKLLQILRELLKVILRRKSSRSTFRK